jgi:hypothetical protein
MGAVVGVAVGWGVFVGWDVKVGSWKVADGWGGEVVAIGLIVAVTPKPLPDVAVPGRPPSLAASVWQPNKRKIKRRIGGRLALFVF